MRQYTHILSTHPLVDLLTHMPTLKRHDPREWSPIDVVVLLNYVVEVASRREETQLRGFAILSDMSRVKLVRTCMTSNS